MASPHFVRPAVIIAAAAALAGLAGCGTAPAGAASNTAVGAGQVRPAGGPPAGRRAEAVAAVARLLGSLTFPDGTRRLPGRPIPVSLRQSGQPAAGLPVWVGRHRLYRLAMTPAAAAAYFSAHRPAGTIVEDTGKYRSPGGVTLLTLSMEPRRMPAGVYGAELTENIAPGPRGSALLLADAAAMWYPPRSAAEYLNAARFRSVRVTASGLHGARTTVWPRPTVRAVVALLDGLHAAPPVLISCPGPIATYRLAFLPAVPAQPPVVVTADGCLEVSVAVGGREQPALWDGNKLMGLAAKLFRSAHRGRRHAG
jgi:hypothetical protein